MNDDAGSLGAWSGTELSSMSSMSNASASPGTRTTVLTSPHNEALELFQNGTVVAEDEPLTSLTQVEESASALLGRAVAHPSAMEVGKQGEEAENVTRIEEKARVGSTPSASVSPEIAELMGRYRREDRLPDMADRLQGVFDPYLEPALRESRADLASLGVGYKRDMRLPADRLAHIDAAFEALRQAHGIPSLEKPSK